ncbi:MAG: hypothetical protein ABIK62_06280 [candidate division WOR-3 bacterium]
MAEQRRARGLHYYLGLGRPGAMLPLLIACSSAVTWTGEGLRVFRSETVRVGSGILPQPSMWCIHFNFYRSQQVYTGRELDFQGMITAIGFCAAELGSDEIRNCRHWLKEVNDSCFRTDTWEHPGTEVWSGDLVVDGSGWTIVELQVPFHHDRSKGLVVSFAHQDSTAEAEGHYYLSTFCVPVPGYRSKWGMSDVNPLPQVTGKTDRANLLIVYAPDPLRSDAQATRIVRPRDTVDFEDTLLPAAVVRNNGVAAIEFPVTFATDDGYHDTARVGRLAPGESAEVTFSRWVAAAPGMRALRCSTALSGDEEPRNDLVLDSCFVRFCDACVCSIVALPDTVDSGTVIAPGAEWGQENAHRRGLCRKGNGKKPASTPP